MHPESACERVRRLAFDHRRGEIEAVAGAFVDGHLEECGACRDWRIRLDGLVDGARDAELPDRPADPDALFARIAGAVAARGAGEGLAESDGPAEREDLAESDDPAEPVWPGRRPFIPRRAVAIGAGLVTAAAAALFLLSRPDPAVEVLPSPGGDGPDPVAWRTAESPLPSTRIFADGNARWSWAGAGSRVLVLEEGAVLVAFQRAADEEGLRVVGPTFEIDVLGTVFWASAEGEGQVGVAAGEVAVRRGGAAPVRLRGGERLRMGGVPEPAGEETLRTIGALVDLAPHRIPAEDAPPAEPSTAGAPEPRGSVASPRPLAPAAPQRRAHPEAMPEAPAPVPEDTWARAEDALRAGDPHEAARILESHLAGLPPGSEAAGALHLDLARLYTERLDRPGHAAEHLRRFVDGWPGDVAAPAAQRALCRTLAGLGEDDPRCEGAR